MVGINSQIYSRSGGFMGISFAIPIDEAMRVADQLRSNGRVVRGRIGVQIAPVTKEVAESIGLGKRPPARLVRSVEKDGPAEKAGVEAGDIITKVDGKAVEKSGDLPRIIGSIKPGSQEHAAGVPPRRHARPEVTVAEFGRAPVAPSAPRPNPACGAAGEERARADGVRPDRRAEAELRVRGGVKVDAVDGARPAPAARGRRHPVDRQRRGRRRQAVRGRLAAKAEKARP